MSAQPKWLIDNKSGFNGTDFWWGKVLALQCHLRLGQMADLGNEPVTSDDEEACFENVWYPWGVAKLRLESREISISPWKKLKCLRLTSYTKYFFFFLGRKSGLLTVNGLFCLIPKGWRVSKGVFSRSWEIKALLFFGHTKQKLKTIEVVFIYSKRSTGFWYCERCQGPEKTSGTQTVIKIYFVFFFSNIFQSLSKFQERTSGTVTVRNSKVLFLCF